MTTKARINEARGTYGDRADPVDEATGGGPLVGSIARRPRRVLVALGLAVLAVLIAARAAAAGDVGGTIRLVGPRPLTEFVRLTADHHVCGDEPRPSERLLLSSGGGVQNAVVTLGHERLERWRSPATFQMDQRRCRFVPHVLIVPPGATVEVLNSDGVLHNFHTLGRLNPSRNIAQSGRAKPIRLTFAEPEIVPVKCDLHGPGSMRAWIVVARHPYYALTDEEGRFRLPDVPAGPHILEIWHETLGTREIPITVGATGTVSVDVAFPSSRP